MAKIQYAKVNEKGELILPPQFARELGIVPGAEIRIEPDGHGAYLHPSPHGLRRVYVEVTNTCNLNCSTCMRNVWDTAFGQMSMEVFERILMGLEQCAEKPELFLGGYGEPLAHPKILLLIERAKARGFRVSMITNGTLLTPETSRRLIDLKLDMLWVSLDGASAECYADVRLGDMLPAILSNLVHLRSLKYQQFGLSVWSGYPRLGIAFVAMKRNIQDLGEVIRMGSRLGATEFSVSNVLAHNESPPAGKPVYPLAGYARRSGSPPHDPCTTDGPGAADTQSPGRSHAGSQPAGADRQLFEPQCRPVSVS